MHKFFSKILFLIILILQASCAQNQNSNKKDALENKFGIVIHGGAGTILKKNMSDEKEKNSIRQNLKSYLCWLWNFK